MRDPGVKKARNSDGITHGISKGFHRSKQNLKIIFLFNQKA